MFTPEQKEENFFDDDNNIDEEEEEIGGQQWKQIVVQMSKDKKAPDTNKIAGQYLSGMITKEALYGLPGKYFHYVLLKLNISATQMQKFKQDRRLHKNKESARRARAKKSKIVEANDKKIGELQEKVRQLEMRLASNCFSVK